MPVSSSLVHAAEFGIALAATVDGARRVGFSVWPGQSAVALAAAAVLAPSTLVVAFSLGSALGWTSPLRLLASALIAWVAAVYFSERRPWQEARLERGGGAAVLVTGVAVAGATVLLVLLAPALSGDRAVACGALCGWSAAMGEPSVAGVLLAGVAAGLTITGAAAVAYALRLSHPLAVVIGVALTVAAGSLLAGRAGAAPVVMGAAAVAVAGLAVFDLRVGSREAAVVAGPAAGLAAQHSPFGVLTVVVLVAIVIAVEARRVVHPRSAVLAAGAVVAGALVVGGWVATARGPAADILWRGP